MRAAGPRPEHVIAAAWAEAYLTASGAPVRAVKANGVTIEAPALRALALVDGFKTEPRTVHIIERIFAPLVRGGQWLLDDPDVPAVRQHGVRAG
jgi:hypothetical protein